VVVVVRVRVQMVWVGMGVVALCGGDAWCGWHSYWEVLCTHKGCPVHASLNQLTPRATLRWPAVVHAQASVLLDGPLDNFINTNQVPIPQSNTAVSEGCGGPQQAAR
jgi:hypothetical protein